MNHYIQSITTNGKLLFKISATFEENTINLTVFKNETAWNANVLNEDLVTQSKNHNTTFDEYYANLRKYIECCPKDVEFDFSKNGDFSINLLLKNKMKMLFFQCSLHKVKFSDSMFDLVDTLYTKKVQYFNELNDLKIQHANVKNAYDTVEQKLNEFLDRKKSDELKLYNNFIAILNEKKRHIQHINDLLIAFRQGRPTINPPVQVKRKKTNPEPAKNKKIVKNTHESSSESEPDDVADNDSNYETDDDERAKNKVLNQIGDNDDDDISRENPNLSPIPSTSKIKDEYHIESPSTSPTQPFVFPKRVRRENNLEMDSVLPKEGIMEDSVEDNEKISKDFANNKNEKLPVVNFSTQDLLDNL